MGLPSPSNAVVFGVNGQFFFAAQYVAGILCFCWIAATRIVPILRAQRDPRFDHPFYRLALVLKYWVGAMEVSTVSIGWNHAYRHLCRLSYPRLAGFGTPLPGSLTVLCVIWLAGVRNHTPLRGNGCGPRGSGSGAPATDIASRAVPPNRGVGISPQSGPDLRSGADRNSHGGRWVLRGVAGYRGSPITPMNPAARRSCRIT